MNKLIALITRDLDGCLSFLEQTKKLPSGFMKKFCSFSLIKTLIDFVEQKSLTENIHLTVFPFLPFIPEEPRTELLDRIYGYVINVLPKYDILEIAPSILPF